MACNYSNKFLPLVKMMANRFEDREVLKAKFAELFTNPDDAIADIEGKITFATEKKETTIKEPVKLNTRQVTIGVQSGSSVASAYLGRSDAYSTMIKNFRRSILELSRIKIDFETKQVNSFESNADQNGISILNRNILNYKLNLLKEVLKEKEEDFLIIRENIEQALSDKDFDLASKQLDSLVNSLQVIGDVPEDAYDAYVILTSFDKLLKQECPFIEIDSRYGNSESVKKYKYIGANVSHFTGWTSSEFADSMDQASMLVKAILDYIPEVNEKGDPIEGSSIGLSGFYSVMSAMRNTLLYHPDENLLEIRKDLLKGTKVDMVKLINAYIKYLQSPTQNTGNIGSFFDSHKTYLIGKLKGIRDFIFDSNIDKELKDIFNNMFFKNVQMSYVAYTYDLFTSEFGGTDLKANVITQQAYTLSGAIASTIFNWRKNADLYKPIIHVNDTYKGQKVKYKISSYNDRTGEATIMYNGKVFSFSPRSINTTFELSEFKDIFFDLFGYMIPDDYVTVGKQINGGNNKWDYTQDLGKILRLGLQGGCFKWGQFEYEDEYPTNLQKWYSDFATVGKVISTIYGADTVNVIKNVSKKNNLPLFGLTSLAYNFPFIMWNHMDSDQEESIYKNSFLFDRVDDEGKVITQSIVGEPKIRSEVLYEGKVKSASKLTVAEVARLSILDDFYRNFADKENDHIYLQNATFADKGTHFLVNYNLNTPIYKGKTLRDLISEQMKTSSPNKTDMFRLLFDSRRKRIKQLVSNILSDYKSVFGREFSTLFDVEAYIKSKNWSHDDVRNKFAEKGVNFYEEIHLSKGKINETISLYYDTYTSESRLQERLDEQRKAFAKDLKSNRVKFAVQLDSISKQIGETYKTSVLPDGETIDWVMPDGTILLSVEVNGKTVLHPVLEGYFMSNTLLSNEYNEVMIGGVYAHSKNTESSRLIAQIKRSVIFGATMHSFAQGLENGVADEVNIACMPDVQAYVQNIVGTEQQNDSMDGSGLCTMLQARLESNSLLDARVGYDKKSIGHDIDSKYGRPSLLKWAVYAMTNARRRIAFGSNISQEVLCKKAYSHSKIKLTSEELNEILKKIGPVYFKDVENTGKYYKIVSVKVDPETGVIKRALQEVTANGTELGTLTSDSIVLTETLWDIDQLFGGAWTMTFDGDKLDYSESNVDALEAYVTKHQEAKTAQIGYLVNKSAMKVGIGNLNSKESWTDGSALNIIKMRTRYIGVQMDAEHHLDENEVTEMTQMISALSENGYTSHLVNSIYTDIGNVIVEALKEYNAVIDSNNPEEIYQLLGEIFIKSFENNDRDTLGLAQAFVLKATKALKAVKESNGRTKVDFKIPFSAETVNGLFVSTVSSLLTKKGIRRKYEGFAGVLTPSYNMMQYYNVGGKTMMHDRFADLVRESGIRSFNTTKIKQDVPTTKIISGAQSGVDTIGLEVGLELGLQTGGTTTPGFVREQGFDAYDANSLQTLFGLQEITPELQGGRRGREFYLPRTEQNVINSDGTVYFASDANSAGRIATERFANAAKKPFIINPTAEELRAWLIKNNIRTLNVAGNRGSKLSPNNNIADILRSALDRSATSKAINNIYINGELNPFLQKTTADQIDFEDTVVIFDKDIDENPIKGTEQIMYLQSFTDYDTFKHMDLSGKVIRNFTSRPKNLKATNTKFKEHGVQKSVYELDSVRAMFYYKQGIRSEFVQAVLMSRGYTAVESNNMFNTLQKIVQRDLRNLEKGKHILKIALANDGTFTTTKFIATNVQVIPAQLITGRYHAKEFMMDSQDNVSDILEKKEGYFVNKLRNKYNFTDDEPEWTETVLFTESGERYLVRTANEDERTNLIRDGFAEDTSIEKINGTFYSGEDKITKLEGVSFHKYLDEETGKVWNVVIVDSKETKRKLLRSSFFDFYRHNYQDDFMRDREHDKWKKRIDRKASRMYQSFLYQRKMLGTRIPTQAMQSFMPMEIVGFTDSAVNDVYVPVQQFFLQGSDLDIDKVYLLGYGINDSGKLFINSKLADIDVEYTYDQLLELLPPNGIEYEISETVDDDTYLINTSRLSDENWIPIINDVIKSGKSKIAFDLEDSRAERFLYQLNTHTTTELSDKDIDAAIKNQVVHNVLKVASNAENQVIAQISVDAATKPLKDAAEDSPLKVYEKTITSDNPMTVFTMQVQNMVGREVIGITAVALKQFFAKTAFYNDKINRYLEDCIKNPSRIKEYTDELLQRVVKDNPLTGQQTVFANLNFLDVIDAINERKIEDVDIDLYGFKKLSTLMAWLQAEADKNDAALTISGILTLATDNAKELILSKLNATSSLVDIYTYLTALGTDTKTIADIMIPGSFTYIAKLQEGDLFDSFTRKISIENAIKFYLGEYTFGIPTKVLKGLFNAPDAKAAKSATFDDEKVQAAIDKCVEAIAKNKQQEAELKAWRRERIENGLDPNEGEDEGYNEGPDPEEMVDENGHVVTPPTPIESLSTPEIYGIISYLKECLERNANRREHAKDKKVDENLRLILTKVLPGVKEQSMMGKMAGINQGLKTKTFDKIAFKQNIENYINGCVINFYESSIKNIEDQLTDIAKRLKRTPNDESLISDQTKLLEQLSALKLEYENISEFDFYDFVVNEDYQKSWIKKMNILKNTDNILEIIVNVPHFKQMLNTWAVDETLLTKASARYNLEKELLESIKPETTYMYKDLEFRQIKNYVNDTLILSWLLDRKFTIKIPADQREKYGIKTYNAIGNLVRYTKDELTLDSVLAIDSFKHLMEDWIVPELKKQFENNAFLQALIKTTDKTKSGTRSYLKLPISMMDIDKSVELETKYNSYLNAFDEISTQTFAGMKIADLFYLYNLIVNKDSFGQKSMTRLFENLVNSEKGSFLVNDYNRWISELDSSKDFSILKMNEEDLMGRISKYVPNTKIVGKLDGIMTQDSCFEVPNLADSPEAIWKREMLKTMSSDSRLPLTSILNNVYMSQNWSSDITVLTEGDWNNDLENDYLNQNKESLKGQKAFIYDGKLYINFENAGVGDLIHEWAHVILSQMKWSDDPSIRDRYYEIVAKVVNHPRFNDIAKNYPWAHGSDLQEEVLANLFQMYLQNKIFKDDNILSEIIDVKYSEDITTYNQLKNLVEKIFKITIDENIDLGDTTVGDLLDLFGGDFYNQYLSHDNSYVLKKHQKISAMKDKMIKEDMLKMICE